MTATLDFELPDELIATEPTPLVDVRLLVGWRSREELVDTAFAALPRFLEPGDVVVVNASAMVPAALPAGEGLVVHLSTELPGGFWVVELRRRTGHGSAPFPGGRPGRVALPSGGAVELLAPYPAGMATPRLWLARLDLPEPVLDHLARAGQPIRYGEPARPLGLDAYATAFGVEPGSVELPSAGRAFTPELVTELVTAGIGIAPIVLHTGVSSQEAGEPPYPERYRVPTTTADAVTAATGRVIAVGTTATRALETTADERGRSHPGSGWTDLVLGPDHPVRVVDGLLTGWHEPRASHLALLEAVAGRPLLERSYERALVERYRWHEFGDLHLVLP
jgi:S-adenosylmethionine:tRNA ribosyltransferase-isomerase